MTTRASCGRREFLRESALAAFAFRLSTEHAGAPRTLVVVALETPRDTPRGTARGRGVTMGVEEAARSARLFSGDVRVERVTTLQQLDRRLGGKRASGELIGVVGGETANECLALAAAAGRSDAVYVNTLCTSDELRGRSCNRRMFHVAPSDRMIADARGDSAAVVTAWDASLRSFGADTLNQRFRARFDRAMDGDAWAGWFAVKALTEGTLRARQGETAALIAYLESANSGIDGHKGRPLSFRAWDHQLRQPLYLVSPNGKTVAEVPAASANPSGDSRDVLDLLGTTQSDSSCRFEE
jgi:hypothetical protein